MMNESPRFAGDQALLRRVNFAAVLSYLRLKAPLSRAALAELTGLNPATITRLVRELIDQGFVREIGAQTSTAGRPSILLEMNPEAGYILGARVDVDSHSVILANFASEIIWRHDENHRPTDDKAAVQENLLHMIHQAGSQASKNGRRILGLGLSLPGLVDANLGTLLFAPNLGWSNTPMKDWLKQSFDFPIYVDNEANLAALGEAYFGAARDCNFVLYINITAGVGAGIVLNQRILPGSSGLAGEVGHMTIDPNGGRCNCGNYGCWETYVSAPVIFRRIREAIRGGLQSGLSMELLENFNRTSIPAVVEAAKQGDPAVRSAFEETAKYIGMGLANLINIFNPRRVVLGGYLSPIYPFILKTIHSVVQERALKWSSEATDIVVASCGSDASLMGAIATIYDHVLNYPTYAFT